VVEQLVELPNGGSVRINVEVRFPTAGGPHR